jgi:O-antigen ligase
VSHPAPTARALLSFPSGRHSREPGRWRRGGALPDGWLTPVLCVGAVAVLAVGVVFSRALPVSGPVALFLVASVAALGALMLGSPMTALVLLIFASFTRLAITIPGLPAEPMALCFAALLVAVVIAGVRGTVSIRFGWLEAVMIAYLAWNVLSAFLPHTFPATVPTTGEPVVVYRFILSGTVLPFLAFVVGWALIRDTARLRLLLYTVLVVAGYSAVVSIMQFTGPFELVWPRYIVDAPNYPERANGIFNQPVVNGLVLVAGFMTAIFLVHEHTLSRFPRVMAAVVALLCIPGIYLTRTRAVWLVFALAILMCAVFARGRRTGFVATLLVAALFIGGTWSTFTSSDRASGGVASSNEVDDRFNAIATSLWAIREEPLLGWGIGRFAQVNTHYHRKWDESMDWTRGYAIASHENELGIATELGLVGLALWLAVLGLLGAALVGAMRRLSRVDDLAGRPLGLLALTVLATWVVCGFTVDLRFFDFANLLVFLLVGTVVGIAARIGKPAVDERPVPVLVSNGAPA